MNSRADKIAQMENICSAFIQFQNDHSMKDAEFLLTENAGLDAPDFEIRSRGAGQICFDLQRFFDQQKNKGICDWHIPHNLCGKLNADERSGMVYAETHSFRADRNQNSFCMFCMRYDFDLCLTEAGWKISQLRWYALQWFQPVIGTPEDLVIAIPGGKLFSEEPGLGQSVGSNCGADQKFDAGPNCGADQKSDAGPEGSAELKSDAGPEGSAELKSDAGPEGSAELKSDVGPEGSAELKSDAGPVFDAAGRLAACPAEDHILIQNLLGYYAIGNRRGAEELFADSADIHILLPGLTEDLAVPPELSGRKKAAFILRAIEAREKENGNCYLAVPYLGAPVISVQGDRAEGWWMSHTYCMRSAFFGKAGQEDVVRRIERFHCRFIKEQNVWKFLSLETEVFAQLPPEPIDRNVHGQAPLWDGKDHWPDLPEHGDNYAGDYPEDVYALQRIFPEWALRLRRAEMQKTPELIFIADQQRMDLDINVRRNLGIEAIMPRLREFDENCRPHETTSHNTSSPLFYINRDGSRAEVSWFDQSWTNMNAVFKRNDEPVQFMLNIGEYRFSFEKNGEGDWKVRRIWWRVIYRLPDIRMDKSPRCFCNTDKEHLWPMPFETVVY